MRDIRYRVIPVGRKLLRYVEEYVPLSPRRGCKLGVGRLSHSLTRHLRIRPNWGCFTSKCKVRKNLGGSKIDGLNRFALLVHKFTIGTVNLRWRVSRACGLPITKSTNQKSIEAVERQKAREKTRVWKCERPGDLCKSRIEIAAASISWHIFTKSVSSKIGDRVSIQFEPRNWQRGQITR